MYSIVIPTYNRAHSLIRTLNSVVVQTVGPKDYEVLVIDDGSTDDTKELIVRFTEERPCHQIRYLRQHHQGSAAAKNLGIKKSTGDILFFTDDDCVVPLYWMETIIAGYKKYPEVAGVGGWFRPPPDEKRFFQSTAHYTDSTIHNSYSTEEKFLHSYSIPVALASNVSYKREILELVGGFDEKIPALASVELKYKIMAIHHKPVLYVPVLVTHHCDLNFVGYLKKIFRQGRCRYYTNTKYFGANPPLSFDTAFSSLARRFYYQCSRFWGERSFAVFIFFALVDLFSSFGGFYERRFGSKVG